MTKSNRKKCEKHLLSFTCFDAYFICFFYCALSDKKQFFMSCYFAVRICSAPITAVKLNVLFRKAITGLL
jgi:hypothetical protein